MTDDTRERAKDLAKDLLPDWVNGTLGPEERALVERELAVSPKLRAEADFVREVREARRSPPADLQGRIRLAMEQQSTVGSGRAWSSYGRWPLSAAAAAAVVIALGSALIWNRFQPGGSGTEGQLALEPLPVVWPADDGLVAGEALLDDLSEDALVALLEELGG